jgi:hypothetical protein
VARRPLTFLCFAKEEVSKRKATADLPFGCLRFASAQFMHHKKWEISETRFAQTTDISNPFSVTHKLLRPERNSSSKATSNSTQIHDTAMILASRLAWFRFDVDLDLPPLGTQPIVCCRKWIRRVSDLSHFLQHTIGHPKGKSAVAFFLLTIFLAKQEKVSGRRATPGLVLQRPTK